jgi:hypothetical protein
VSYSNDPNQQQPSTQSYLNQPYPPHPQIPAQPFPSPFPVSAPAPPDRHRAGGRLLLIVAFAVVALASCGVGAAIGSSSSSTPSSATVLPAVTVTVTQGAVTKPAAPTTETTKAPTTKAPAATQTAPATGVKTVLSLHGSGIKNTAKFATGRDWTIHYTYNCAAFGGSGNFAVTTYTGGDLDDIVINDLGRKGDDTAPVYDDPGTHYLSVNSECSWTIRVTA